MSLDRRRMSRPCLVSTFVVLSLLGGAGSLAFSQSTDLTTSPLRLQTREVVLDIVVTDRHGNFVNGLGKDDFTVQEDKTNQRIVYFQPPAFHAMPADEPEVRSTADLQRIGNAPVTILVLDELNTSFADMAFARGSLEKWLSRQPPKLSQPAVLMVASDEKFALLHDYTQDRDALLATLKKHFPSYPYRMSKGGATGPDAGERMALSLGTLMQIAQASGGTPGRKNVIWVGVGFPQLLLDDVSGTKEAEITKAAARAISTMLKSRVTLNVIDPTAMADSSLDLNNTDYLSLSTLQSTMGPTSATVSGILNFDTFAPATGGALFAGRNDVDQEIAQAVSNGSNYYTLSYSPTNHDDKAVGFRNIQIVMRDPNLKATTRTGYFPDVQTAPGVKPPAPTTHDLAFDLTTAALNSVVYNGLKVALEGPTVGAGYTLQVRNGDLQPHTLGNGKTQAEVTVMEVCFGAKNKVLSHQAFELMAPLALTDPQSALVTFTTPENKIPAGTQRIRFVVRDALTGHIGTADKQLR